MWAAWPEYVPTHLWSRFLALTLWKPLLLSSHFKDRNKTLLLVRSESKFVNNTIRSCSESFGNVYFVNIVAKLHKESNFHRYLTNHRIEKFAVKMSWFFKFNGWKWFWEESWALQVNIFCKNSNLPRFSHSRRNSGDKSGKFELL